MGQYNRLVMPEIISGRGSLSFIKTLGKKRIAVLGYDDSVKKLAEQFLSDSDTEVQYIATISHEPLISDIYDNLETVLTFEPDLILAIGGGSVMDVAKGLHLFYENPEMSFEDSLVPFGLPALGKKADLAAVPTTSGTGSEASSAAVFIDPETKVKKLLLSNTLIPHYAILDADFTDGLPDRIQIETGLDALCHAIESLTAKNSSTLTRFIAMQAAIDILQYLPDSVRADASEEVRREAKERLHVAASMAGVAITNSFTGIVHSYDHPGPAFGIPHGVVCGIMLPYAIRLIGEREEYSAIAKCLGYQGEAGELKDQLINRLQQLNASLGIPNNFKEYGIDEKKYFEKVPVWAEVSLNAGATKLSPAGMDAEKGHRFYEMCYYG